MRTDSTSMAAAFTRGFAATADAGRFLAVATAAAGSTPSVAPAATESVCCSTLSASTAQQLNKQAGGWLSCCLPCSIIAPSCCSGRGVHVQGAPCQGGKLRAQPGGRGHCSPQRREICSKAPKPSCSIPKHQGSCAHAVQLCCFCVPAALVGGCGRSLLCRWQQQLRQQRRQLAVSLLLLLVRLRMRTKLSSAISQAVTAPQGLEVQQSGGGASRRRWRWRRCRGGTPRYRSCEQLGHTPSVEQLSCEAPNAFQ